jgi:hypothetical protein
MRKRGFGTMEFGLVFVAGGLNLMFQAGEPLR